MPSETILDMVFTAFVGGGLGALIWARMNRLEAGQEAIRAEVARIWERMATREELEGVRAQMATKDDFSTLREDMRGMRGEMSEMRGEMGGLRGEMAVMRSDLTHVALAVGANRPKPTEGETSAN